MMPAQRIPYCRCRHDETDHEPRGPQGFLLCQVDGCFCVEFIFWGSRETEPTVHKAASQPRKKKP